MSALLTEDLQFVLSNGEMPQAITVRGLLVQLGLERSPLHVQANGIRGWLMDNEPNVNLRRALDRSGLLTVAGQPISV